MKITVSMRVGEFDWLHDYAAKQRKQPEEVIAAAIDRARQNINPPKYIEPGTSLTQRGVVEFEVTLTPPDSQWLLMRASRDRVTPCAVLGDALRGYKAVAPQPREEAGFTMMVRGQTLFYRCINFVCDDVARGKLSPSEADEGLAAAVFARLASLLPEADRAALWQAVLQTIRELCINHPSLRQAHGRDIVNVSTTLDAKPE